MAADALGVNRSHLWRVLAGERKSLSLMARYVALKEEGGPTRRRDAKSPAAVVRSAPGPSRPKDADSATCVPDLAARFALLPAKGSIAG